MKRKRSSFGKQLVELHRWNAWMVAVLGVSGLLLAWGAIRGLGAGRIWIAQLHIAIGIVSGLLILLYIPMARRHWQQLKRRPRQKTNAGFVLILLIGWVLSGLVLWQLRQFPPRWGNFALVAHQLLTYIGLPYILYHSVTRLKWMKQPSKRAIRVTDSDAAAARTADGASNVNEAPIIEDVSESGAVASPVHDGPAAPGPWIDRRQFIKASLGVALAAVALPPFVRWFASVPGGSSLIHSGIAAPSENPNLMLPEPQPLPDSVNVVGGGARGRFQVYAVTPLPVFSSEDWRFTLDGLVERPKAWNWASFLQLARSVQVSDFHCVTGWSVYDNTWEGIPLSALLREVTIKPEASHVKFYSGDGVYTDALTLDQARMDDVMVAVLHDGKPIHRDYGGPVRLIVPRMYAYKSVKWLERIELIDYAHIGYWEERGYDNDAWLKGQGVPL